MNARRTVAVVLAARSDDRSWDEVRYAVPLCGVSAPRRVDAAARAAGISDVIWLVDSPSTLPDDPDLVGASRYVPTDNARREIASRLAGHRVLAVCADLPLLTPETIDALLRTAEADPSSRRVARGGAVAALAGGADSIDALFQALKRFSDRPFGDREDEAWTAADPDDLRRLVSPIDVSILESIARRRKLASLVGLGVIVFDGERTYVDESVRIGAGTRILPGTHLVGQTAVGRSCTLGPDSWIEDSAVDDGAAIRYSVLEGARVRERSTVGPFAHLRPGADVGPEARVGNFVEVKAARLGRGVKAGHLAYLGDADIGEGTNIGAGAIICNYDGVTKHRTVVEDGVFIGSNVSLVAPVTIGRGAFVAAGSTITENVPPQMLALGRARQVLKERKATPSGEEEA